MPGPVEKPWRRSALLSTLSGAALSILGNVPGMGIPGALALVPAAPLVTLIWDVAPQGMFPRDSAWPFAIFVTALMGPLVPAFWLATRALRLTGIRRWLAMVSGMVFGSTLVAVLVYAFGVAGMLAGGGSQPPVNGLVG